MSRRAGERVGISAAKARRTTAAVRAAPWAVAATGWPSLGTYDQSAGRRPGGGWLGRGAMNLYASSAEPYVCRRATSRGKGAIALLSQRVSRRARTAHDGRVGPTISIWNAGAMEILGADLFFWRWQHDTPRDSAGVCAWGRWKQWLDQARDRLGGDRWRDSSRCSLWLCAGRCRLRAQRAARQGAHDVRP